MDREATKVKKRYPIAGEAGVWGVEVFEVGGGKRNPDGKADVVDGIFLTEEWGRVVVISYRDFGTEWVLQHVESIEFRNAEYRDIQANKKRD